jgi:hypothetical protein
MTGGCDPAERVEVAWNGVQYRVKAPFANQHCRQCINSEGIPVRTIEYYCLGLQFEWRDVSIGRLNIVTESTVYK